MWAGTNSGSVFAYALEVPSQEKFSERAVEAVLGKEIQLMHRAPVVAIAVLDGRGNPLPEPYEVSRDLAKAPDMQGSHSMLISSEEQFKVSLAGATHNVSPVLSGCLHRLSCRDEAGGDWPGPGALLCLSLAWRLQGLPWREAAQVSPKTLQVPVLSQQVTPLNPPGLHTAQSERQDQVQADGTRGLPGAEGGPGELGQRQL